MAVSSNDRSVPLCRPPKSADKVSNPIFMGRFLVSFPGLADACLVSDAVQPTIGLWHRVVSQWGDATCANF